MEGTCRDCKKPIREGAIKYAVRHYLHGECAVLRGLDFLSKLSPRQLECLPFGPLKRAGILDDVAKLIILRRIEAEGRRLAAMGAK